MIRSKLVSGMLLIASSCCRLPPKTFTTSIIKPKVIFVLGGPGSGKGTQSAKLSSDFGFIHLSAGELLRGERKSGSVLGQEIESYLKEGRIVPVEMSLGLIQKELQSKGDKDIFLIDGFPRNEENLRGWDSLMSNCKVLTALCLTCSQTEMEKRLIKRSLLSGRSDDNSNVIQKRFSIFARETLPVLNILEQRGCLISIDADKDEETVYQSVKSAVLTLDVGNQNSK